MQSDRETTSPSRALPPAAAAGFSAWPLGRRDGRCRPRPGACVGACMLRFALPFPLVVAGRPTGRPVAMSPPRSGKRTTLRAVCPSLLPPRARLLAAAACTLQQVLVWWTGASPSPSPSESDTACVLCLVGGGGNWDWAGPENSGALAGREGRKKKSDGRRGELSDLNEMTAPDRTKWTHGGYTHRIGREASGMEPRSPGSVLSPDAASVRGCGFRRGSPWWRRGVIGMHGMGLSIARSEDRRRQYLVLAVVGLRRRRRTPFVLLLCTSLFF